MLREIVLTETSVSSSMAKAILEAFYGDDFTNCLPIEGSSSIKNQTVNPNKLAQAYGLNVTVKPNPAKEWAAFDYTLPEGVESAGLEIVDAKGKHIEIIALRGNRGQQLVDTRTWPVGQYVYTLKASGINQSGKLIISK